MKKTLTAVVCLMALCNASPLMAAVVAEYDFEGDSLAPINVAAGVTASNFAYVGSATPSFVAGNGSVDSYTANNWDIDGMFEFSLTIAPGSVLDITDVTFGERRSGTGPTTGEVLIDNINVLSFNMPDDTLWRIQTTNGLSGLTGTVTVSIVGANPEGTSGTWRVDDVIVNGTISAVPEPSSLIAIASVGIAAMVRRRQRI